MAVAIAVDMDAGAMAAEKMAARKPNPATNGLGSDGIDGLQRWGKDSSEPAAAGWGWGSGTVRSAIRTWIRIAGCCPDQLQLNAFGGHATRHVHGFVMYA